MASVVAPARRYTLLFGADARSTIFAVQCFGSILDITSSLMTVKERRVTRKGND